MKRVCFILFAMILAFSANVQAGDINDVNSGKWLDHVSQMQVMRQQILNLLTKQSPTAEDKEMLSALQKSFTEKKQEWDQYLIDVAEGKTEKTSKECLADDNKACDDKEVEPARKGPFHRYDKKPRRHFKNEYHRYDKKYRHGKCKDNCKDEVKGHCSADKKCKKQMKKTACGKCPSEKKYEKKSDCGSCPSHKKQMKKSACASKCEDKKVKCNDGVDCPSCPNYKTEKCCKVSGKCSGGQKHAKKHACKKADKKSECPVCHEYKLMGISKKCARCCAK